MDPIPRHSCASSGLKHKCLGEPNEGNRGFIAFSRHRGDQRLPCLAGTDPAVKRGDGQAQVPGSLRRGVEPDANARVVLWQLGESVALLDRVAQLRGLLRIVARLEFGAGSCASYKPILVARTDVRQTRGSSVARTSMEAGERTVARFDIVELTDSVDDAPAGARGGCLSCTQTTRRWSRSPSRH